MYARPDKFHFIQRMRLSAWDAAGLSAGRQIGLRMSTEGEFNFGAGSPGEGHSRWLAERKLATVELARRLNLPLQHEVEVWLIGGIRLRGKLQLSEEMLFIEDDYLRHLELQVDLVPFKLAEMESCVRLD